MSIALMTVVWRLDLSPSDKMVLLALADAANDDGVTWMAVSTRNPAKLDLQRKCSLSERAVQGAIKRLCDGGYLSRFDRPGRGVIWTVTPAGNAPPQEMHPRNISAPAPSAPAPAAGAGKPSLKPHPSSEAKASSEDAGAKKSTFDEFWTAYPSKVGKGAARKAFDVAVRKIRQSRPSERPLEVLLDGLHRAVTSARWRDPTYTRPNPATWLNQERWDDVYEPPPSGSGGPSSPKGPSAMSAETLAQRRALLTETSANV
ncbi:helix-turn-helix domain-containing protein [Brevundimonas sp.]|uniref:helix-turn-helix domain-containing protein n=1 Tax=Brevundimonas sp. TaxID=1871086 RepID=UPI002FC5E498